MFSRQSMTEILILAIIDMSSANAFNLDQSRILSFGKKLDTICHTSQVFKVSYKGVFKRLPSAGH